jgi:hypothetical protein
MERVIMNPPGPHYFVTVDRARVHWMCQRKKVQVLVAGKQEIEGNMQSGIQKIAAEADFQSLPAVTSPKVLNAEVQRQGVQSAKAVSCSSWGTESPGPGVSDWVLGVRKLYAGANCVRG